MTAPSSSPVPAAPARFHLAQKISPMQNVYRVHADAAGEPGPLIAFAKQKRLAFKESVTLYRDESAREPVLSMKADRALDVRSVMTVREPSGAVVGTLRKRGAVSLLRSTWELEQPGLPVVVVEERSLAVALLRRLWELVPFVGDVPVPWVFHFDGRTPSGEVVFSHTRRWGLRDRYVLEVSPPYDARLGIALAICLDALQSR